MKKRDDILFFHLNLCLKTLFPKALSKKDRKTKTKIVRFLTMKKKEKEKMEKLREILCTKKKKFHNEQRFFMNFGSSFNAYLV